MAIAHDTGFPLSVGAASEGAFETALPIGAALSAPMSRRFHVRSYPAMPCRCSPDISAPVAASSSSCVNARRAKRPSSKGGRVRRRRRASRLHPSGCAASASAAVRDAASLAWRE